MVGTSVGRWHPPFVFPEDEALGTWLALSRKQDLLEDFIPDQDSQILRQLGFDYTFESLLLAL